MCHLAQTMFQTIGTQAYSLTKQASRQLFAMLNIVPPGTVRVGCAPPLNGSNSATLLTTNTTITCTHLTTQILLQYSCGREGFSRIPLLEIVVVTVVVVVEVVVAVEVVQRRLRPNSTTSTTTTTTTTT